MIWHVHVFPFRMLDIVQLHIYRFNLLQEHARMHVSIMCTYTQGGWGRTRAHIRVRVMGQWKTSSN